MLAERQTYYSPLQMEPLLTADGRPVTIVKADTLRLKEEAFRIRYEVYCRHLAYESGTNFNGLETDIYDGWSKHYLVRDELTGRYVGTIRLVAPECRVTQSIPIEKIYTGDYLESGLSPQEFDEGTYVEISRLAVLPEVSRDISHNFSIEVARLLYLSALAYFHANSRLAHVHCLMEKRLARRLSFIGLPFVQAGGFIEYRGARAPYYFGKTTTTVKLRGDSKSIYQRLLAAEQRRLSISLKAA